MQPFISIGITTYNRKHLLKRCLDSVLNQINGDFEVLVGNNYVHEKLHGELFGITDSRIKFINYEKNLGQGGNINALLNYASGKYFTWQFDDDYYAMSYVERISRFASKYPHINCIFTSYRKVFDETSPPRFNADKVDGQELLDGRTFLRHYWNRRIRALGFTAAYKLNFLKKIGGIELLSEGDYALFSEYLLLFQAAKEERIGYISNPVVFYCVHEGSWGNVNSEAELYEETGVNLIRKSLDVFRSDSLIQDFDYNTRKVVKLVFHDYSKKSAMKPGFRCLLDMQRFFDNHLAIYLVRDKKPTVAQRWILLFIRWKWSVFPLFKSKMKKLLSPRILIYLLRFHARFQ